MSEQVLTVDSLADFDQAVSTGVTLVDFWAPWCGPCRMQSPILDKLAGQFRGRAQIVKVNADDRSDLAGRFGVSSIPTLFLFKNGQVVDRFVGVQDEKTLAAALEKSIA